VSTMSRPSTPLTKGWLPAERLRRVRVRVRVRVGVGVRVAVRVGVRVGVRARVRVSA
jgi:hypothetical protein